MKKAWLIKTIVAVGFLILLTNCGKREAALPEYVVQVTARPVLKRDVPIVLPSVGTLRANQISTIAPEIGGIVSEIRFKDGQRVNEGDVLAIIDNRTQKAAYEAAVATYKEEEWKYQQMRDLFKAQAATDYELTQARFARDKSASLVREARELLDKFTIQAPYDGRLSIRIPDVGDYLAEGAPIVDLVDDDPMLVDYYLPEQYIHALEVGQAVFLQYPNEAGLFQGQVDAINPLISQSSRSVLVRASFPNKENQLASGRFVYVSHQVNVLKDALVVPQAAVSQNAGVVNVFVVSHEPLVESEKKSELETEATAEVEEGEKAAEEKEVAQLEEEGSGLYAVLRTVKLGEYYENVVVIEEGVNEGEGVIVNGWDKLRNNDRIAIVPEVETRQTPTTTWTQPKETVYVNPQTGEKEVLNILPSEVELVGDEEEKSGDESSAEERDVGAEQ